MRSNLKFLTTIFSLTLLVGGFFVFNKVEADGIPMSISTNLPSTLQVGVETDFTVSTIANDDINKMVRAYFTIPSGVSVKYEQGGSYYPLVDVYGPPATGFPLGNISSNFRATVNTSGTYTVTVDFKRVSDESILGTKNITVTADNIPPTVNSVSQTGDSTGGEIVYTFSESMQLMDHEKQNVIAITADKLGIYELGNYSAHQLDVNDVKKVGTIESATLSDNGKTMTIVYTGNLEGKTNMQYVVDAWGLNITDLAGNKMVQATNQIFTVLAEAPTVVSSINDLKTKTITYTFSEPIQLIEQADPLHVTQNPTGLIKIYTAESYATRKVGDPEPTVKFGGSNTATYNQTTNELKIVYTNDIPAGLYLADTWGYTITDLAGNKLDESNRQAIFSGDDIAPTATVSQTGNSAGGTVIYKFNEPVQLMDETKTSTVAITADKLGIYELNNYSNYAQYSNVNLPTKVGTIQSAALSNNGQTMTIVYTGNLEGTTEMKYVVDAWGLNITDLAKNKMVADPNTQVFKVEARAPKVTSVNAGTKGTIVYNFDEPVQLMNAEKTSLIIPDATTGYASSLAIYEKDAYLTHAPGVEPAHVVTISSAFLNFDEKSILITYTGSLIKNADAYYVVDAWGKNITDLVGNKMTQDESQIFLVPGDSTAPTGGTLTIGTSNHTSITTKNPGNNEYVVSPAMRGNDSLLSLSVVVTDANLNTENIPVYIDGAVIANGYMKYNTGTWNYYPSTQINFNTGNHTLSATFTDGINNTLLSFKILTDFDAPYIYIGDYTKTPTNQTIVVNAGTTNDATLNYNSHVFTENGSFDFIATDEAGNVTKETVTITNIDKQAPILIGSASQYTQTKTIKYTFSEPMKLINQATLIDTEVTKDILGIYAIKNSFGDYDNVKVDTITSATLSADKTVLTITYTGILPEGTYVVDAWGYNIADLVGNKIEKNASQMFTITDATAPVINMLGVSPLTVKQYSKYDDAGASVTDNVDKKIEATSTGEVDTNTIGTYTIIYNAIDKAGNSAEPVIRTIYVVRNPSSGGSMPRVATIPATPAVPGISKAIPATPGRVLGADKFNFTKLLKKGLSGNEVMELQKYLIGLGYDLGTADGKFGPKTKAAVIKFQLVNNLKGDGVIGALTRAILNK